MRLDNFEPNYWLLFIIITWLLLIISIVVYKWKEKYQGTTVFIVIKKRNVCLKHYMLKNDETWTKWFRRNNQSFEERK